MSRASPASLASQPGAPPEVAGERDGEREPGTGQEEPLVSGADGDDDEDLPAARGAAAASASADPVKDYLKQIGKVPLLDAEQEVALAKRIEAGLFAEERLNSGDKIDMKLKRELWWIAQDGKKAKNHLLEANLRARGRAGQADRGRPVRRGEARRRQRGAASRPEHRARAGRRGRQEGQGPPGAGQPPPGRLAGQALHRTWHAVPGPDPGGQPGPDPGGGEVRLHQGLQVLHVRHLVDPPGHHPRQACCSWT